MRGASVLVVVLLGCSGPVEHARPASRDCTQPPCSTAAYAGGTAAGTPDAGPPPTAPTGTVTLGGAVGAFADVSFAVATAFTGPGTVGVVGAAGVLASRSFSGATYSLPQVPPSDVLWVSLRPTGASPALPTLTAVDGTLPASADVAFAQSSPMALIFSRLVRQPQTILSTRAQLVLRFVDAAGVPVPGVELTSQPEAGAIVYDDGPLYSDVLAISATQQRGMAIALNVVAPLWPGARTMISFRRGKGGAAQTIDVHLAQGAVSFATVTPK